MLEYHLDKFATNKTNIVFSLSLGMATENPVVQDAGASASRCGEDRAGTRAASVVGHLNDIMLFSRDDVIGNMDDNSAELAALGSAAYDLATEVLSSHILTIETVQAYGDEKGTGLALLLLGATLETLSSGRVITAVLEACPFYPEKLTAEELKAGCKKLRDHWAKLGFRRVSPRSNYMVLVADNYEIPKTVLGDK